MSITTSGQLGFVPSMQDIAKEIELLDRSIKISTSLRTARVTALRKALVRHTVDPIVARCKAQAITKQIEPDLLDFVIRSKNLQGSYKDTKLAPGTVARRVVRIMDAAKSPLLSFYDEEHDGLWLLDDVATDLNLILAPTSPKMLIRTRPSTLRVPVAYKGSPSMDFYGVPRS